MNKTDNSEPSDKSDKIDVLLVGKESENAVKEDSSSSTVTSTNESDSKVDIEGERNGIPEVKGIYS